MSRVRVRLEQRANRQQRIEQERKARRCRSPNPPQRNVKQAELIVIKLPKWIGD